MQRKAREATFVLGPRHELIDDPDAAVVPDSVLLVGCEPGLGRTSREGKVPTKQPDALGVRPWR
jgi:hypothetical protein